MTVNLIIVKWHFLQKTQLIQNFVVDSRSSSYMVNNKNLFDTIEETYTNIKVTKKNENMKTKRQK